MFEVRSKIAIQYSLITILVFVILLTSSGCTSLFPQPLDKLDQDDVKDIESVCLETDVSVPWYEDGEIATSLENLFESLGLTVLGLEDQCDLAVSLNVSGRQKKGGWIKVLNDKGETINIYEEEPYSRVEGELTISLHGYQTLTHTIDKQGTNKWDVPFLPEVLDKLAMVWGDEIYWKAILEADLEFRAIDSLKQRGEEGAIILAQIYQNIEVNYLSTLFAAGVYDLGPDALAAVPFLIETLDDDHPSNKNKASSQFLLRVITGEDFGDDPSAWRSWWEEQ